MATSDPVKKSSDFIIAIPSSLTSWDVDRDSPPATEGDEDDDFDSDDDDSGIPAIARRHPLLANPLNDEAPETGNDAEATESALGMRTEKPKDASKKERSFVDKHPKLTGLAAAVGFLPSLGLALIGLGLGGLVYPFGALLGAAQKKLQPEKDRANTTVGDETRAFRTIGQHASARAEAEAAITTFQWSIPLMCCYRAMQKGYESFSEKPTVSTAPKETEPKTWIEEELLASIEQFYGDKAKEKIYGKAKKSPNQTESSLSAAEQLKEKMTDKPPSGSVEKVPDL